MSIAASPFGALLTAIALVGCGAPAAGDGALGPPPSPLPSDRGHCPDARRALHEGRRLLEEAQSVMQLTAFDPTAGPRASGMLRNAVDCLARTDAADEKRRANQLLAQWRRSAQRQYAVARLRLAMALTDPRGPSRPAVRAAAADILEMLPNVDDAGSTDGTDDRYARWLRRLSRRTL